MATLPKSEFGRQSFVRHTLPMRVAVIVANPGQQEGGAKVSSEKDS
ncbi:MAG: hypothetical protein JNJ46_10625 [Myxococcales bacterium]|nr:hypothetical protein [Myxococcales bacterium]